MLNRRADRLELLRIAEAVALEKSIDKELIIESMENGIAKAAKSKFGSENDIKVLINRDNGDIGIFRKLIIVEKPENTNLEISLDQAIVLNEENKSKEIGDEVLSMNMPGQLDEDNEEWRSCRFADEKTETFTHHSASVQDINFDFAFNYWNINDGMEKITGEHEMLYKPLKENTWMWQLVPNMRVGAHVMDKNGNEVEITSLENVVDNDEGFEVVQIDVEPLDVYFGQTFLVHNKGSDSNPF